MKFTSITQRFVAWFLMVSLLPILLIGYSLLHTFEKELQQTVSQQISAIADKKSDQIDAYLSERVHEAIIKIQSSTVRQAMMTLTQSFSQDGMESAAYQRLNASYHGYFKRLVTASGYYDLFLISPQGTIVYSHAHEADFATNLFTGPYRDSGLAKVARNALSTLESGVSEFEFYAPSSNAIAAFIAVPIINQGKVIGVLALQIDNSRVFQVLLDDTGLGKSGETVVARQEDERTALVMAPLKSDPAAALKHKIPLDDPRRATPLVNALNGERGSGFTIDYLGQPVVAAWRYLPRMKWGMVVKMNTAEALAPFYRMRSFALAVLGLALFAAFIGAVLLGRRVIAPLQDLTNSARDIAAGKFDQRAPVLGRDELGQLGNAFNAMAERLQSFYANLESQVKQRTTELTQALTQEQEALGALHLSEARLNEAQRIAQVGSWELDLLQGKLIWSDEIFHLFEIDKNQFDATYEGFLNAIHPDDRDAVNLAYTQSLQTRSPYEITHRLRMNDGRIKWVHERCSSDFDTEGNPLRSIGTVQDITEQKNVELALEKSESLFRALAQVAPVGIFRTDATGACTYVNEQYCEIAGCSREAAMGEGWAAAIHPDDRMRVFKEWDKSVKNREPFVLEFRFQHTDGQVVWAVCQSRAEMGSHEEVLGYVGTVADISVRKQNEAALIEARRAAEAASRAKSEFLANMSHEIRTPMNAILGLTQLVLDSELSPRQQDFLKKAHTSAQALLGILNDILDFSKIEAGHMGIEQVPFRLEESLQHVADLFGALIEEKGLELFFEIAPDAPAEILGDPLRLAQVLTNLVSNAVKFTERGEIHIKLEVTKQTPTTQRLRFAVRDTGIGLSREQAERLFQPFTQADETTTRKYGGTGLGLSICQRLVELMGGEIAASGAEGQGTTVTFTIQAGIAASHGQEPDLQPIQDLRTLVVDDQETSRIILQQLLHGWGLEAHTAASGAEALTQIETAQQNGAGFDLLLLDWRMPGMDGLEVARRLEQHTAQGKLTRPLRVIMVTAHDKEKLLEQAGATRLNGILTKPVTPSNLLDALANCRQPQALAALAELRDISADEGNGLQGLRVLLVEDNELNRLMAAEFLKRRGVVLTLASHGGEALERVRSETFDAVLMDLHMPVMDGLEATRLIRELPQGKSLPIIAMTAAVLQADRDRCSAVGMMDFIAKPIDPDDMIRVLLKWVKTAPTRSRRVVENVIAPAGNAFPTSLPGFDLAAALHRLDGNRDLLTRLLLDFAREQPGTLAQLDALAAAGDSAQMLSLLHTLKGVAANLGAVALAAAIRQLEETLMTGDLTVSRQSFTDALNAALDAIRTHIEPALPSAGAPAIDRDMLAEVLKRLVPYLQEQELIPVELMEAMRSIARVDFPDKSLARLIRQIDHFDHDGALSSVVQLAAIHGVTLGSEDA